MKTIGLDIGTTSICGVVMDTLTQTLLSRRTLPNATDVSGQRFERLQNPEAILAKVEHILTELIALEPDVEAVGVSSQMHGIVYVDRQGRSVSPLYTWQDERGNRVMGGLKTYCDAFRDRTGYGVATGYGLVTHFYHLMRDELPGSAATFCTIGDYVAMRLADCVKPVTDATLAASLGGFRLADRQFDLGTLRTAGIRVTMLPEVASARTRIGYYRNHIQVFNAVGDNQASYLGAVQDARNALLVNIGTGAQISIAKDTMMNLPHFEVRPNIGPGYLLVGATPNGGNVYGVMEQFFREAIRLFGIEKHQSLYDVMELMLTSHVPKSEPIEVLPDFYGTRHDTGRRGEFRNVTAQNFTPIDLIHATVEGLVNSLRLLYEELPQQVQDEVTCIVGAGNGIRKSRAIQSLLERYFNRIITLTTCDEEAAFGAALYAGGLYGGNDDGWRA